MEVLEGIFIMRNFKQCIATTSNDPKHIIEQGWKGWVFFVKGFLVFLDKTQSFQLRQNGFFTF